MVGNISVRFSVQDAEVVRAALEKLGKDGEAALNRINTSGQAPSAGLKALSAVMDEMRGRAAGLTSSLGVAGTALAAFGPIGIAVGTAIALVYQQFTSAASAIDGFTEKARRLHDLAESTGLARDQLLALESAAKKVGIEGEQVETAILKFTRQMDELRKGGGELRAQLLAIKPALVDQLVNSRSVGDGISILATAYHKLGIEQQNALSAAAFGGRGGTQFSRLMQAVFGQGGVEGITQSARDAGKINDELLDSMRKLGLEAEASSKKVSKLQVELFGEAWQSSIIKTNELWADFYGWLLKIKNLSSESIVNWLGDLVGMNPESATREKLVARAPLDPHARLKAGLEAGATKMDMSQVYYPASFKDESDGKDPHFWEREANKFREFSSVLGAAATPAEQLKLKMFELMATVEKNGTVSGAAARALDEFKFSQQQAAVATRERLGIASQDEILTIRITELERERTKRFIRGADEMATAAKLRGKEARDAFERIQIKASDFPGLKQLEIDAGRLDKQLDKFGTETATAVSNSLVDIASGTKSASDGFKDLGNSVVRSLSQMLIQMTIVKPLANSLVSVLGSFLPGASSAGAASSNPGQIGSFHAMGNAFLGGNIVPFASGGIVGRPTLFPMAGGAGLMGESGPEAVMPLRRLPSGRLGVESGGGGGAAPTINIFNSSGEQARTETRTAPDGRAIVDVFIGEWNKRYARGDFDNAFKARHGVVPNRQRR